MREHAVPVADIGFVSVRTELLTETVLPCCVRPNGTLRLETPALLRALVPTIRAGPWNRSLCCRLSGGARNAVP
jgi:hypothetical protein